MHKILKRFLFLKFILFFSVLNAQTKKNSLHTKSYKQLNNIYLLHKYSDSVKAKKIAQIFLEKAQSSKDIQKIADGFYMQYAIHETQIQYLDSIIDLLKNKNNTNHTSHAYFKKAQYFLYKKRNIKKTLLNLDIARKKYIKNIDTTDLSFRMEYMIGIIKSEHLNEKEEALDIYKQCERYYGKQTKYTYRLRHLNLLHALSETYISVQQPDSCSFYNRKGYSIASKGSDNHLNQMKYFFTLCEGINQYHKQNYKIAIDSISKALPTIQFTYKDISNTLDSYFYIGKSYFDLNKREKAIPYFIKTDSILETLNYTPQYKHVKTYEYLKNYYKDRGDIDNQHKYLDKLNSILKKYLNDQALIQKKVNKDYDIPLLLSEKENLIKKLNTNNTKYRLGIVLLILSLVICGSLLYHQYRKRSLYRLRFEELMTKSKPTATTNIPKQQKLVSKTDDSQIPEKHVHHILKRLDKFEENHDYLASGLNSQIVANQIDTNLKYFSFVINQYKNKNFTQYINELRINYAIKELQENAQLRKYTIKAIAHELGYNSAETFSNAFYKQVKIKPSYYIKELNKKSKNISENQ